MAPAPDANRFQIQGGRPQTDAPTPASAHAWALGPLMRIPGRDRRGFAKGKTAGAEGVPAMKRSREEGPSHPAHSRPADPPALDGIPNFYYAGMYDIVNKSAYKVRSPITRHHLPATNQSVALKRSSATISSVPNVSLVWEGKVRPIAQCSEKGKFPIRHSASPIRLS